MKLVESAIRSPVKTAVGVILLMLFGILAVIGIPIQLTPTVEEPLITVQTFWPGASPGEVEREIIDEQEEQLKGLDGLVKMSSSSQDSFGTINLLFEVGTDKSANLLRVSNRLEQVPDYPDDAHKPVILAVDPNQSAIAWFILLPSEARSLHRRDLEALRLRRRRDQAGARAGAGRRALGLLRRPRARDAGDRRPRHARRPPGDDQPAGRGAGSREPQLQRRRLRRGQAPLRRAHRRRVRLAGGHRGDRRRRAQRRAAATSRDVAEVELGYRKADAEIFNRGEQMHRDQRHQGAGRQHPRRDGRDQGDGRGASTRICCADRGLRARPGLRRDRLHRQRHRSRARRASSSAASWPSSCCCSSCAAAPAPSSSRWRSRSASSARSCAMTSSAAPST